MRRKPDELGGRVEEFRPGGNQALPPPFEDERYLIPEAEFVLIPLLATDPLPYLLNQDGEPVDVDGRPLRDAQESAVSPEIRELQSKASADFRS